MSECDITLSDKLREFLDSVERDKIMSSDELERLLDFAVCLARDYFAHAGEIRPHWIMQRADGSVVDMWLSNQPTGGRVLDMPQCRKDEVAAILAKQFIAHDAVRYAFIAEAWQGSPNSSIPPSLDPNRIEIVQVVAENRERGIGAAMEIIRPAGQKLYLSKPKQHYPTAGRLTGLLH
jgi:hypothetical protein